MLFRKKLILGLVSLTIITSITVTTQAAEQTWGTKVSGGENHTLVLTENNAVSAFGENYPISLKFLLNSTYPNGIIDNRPTISFLWRIIKERARK